MDVLKWHVDNLKWGSAKKSDLLFPSRVGGFQARSALDGPFADVAEKMGLKKAISPRAMRRTYQDLARAAEMRPRRCRRSTAPSR
jgi:hypothetical protein